MRTLYSDDLQEAYGGSYYAIVGTGDPLDEWVTNYEELLEKKGIGKPEEWVMTTGESVNAFAGATLKGEIHARDKVKSDLTILLFPLAGLEVGRLAIFKAMMQDRWFDDIIDNMRVWER